MSQFAGPSSSAVLRLTMAQSFIDRPDHPEGPYTPAELKARAASGRLLPTDKHGQPGPLRLQDHGKPAPFRNIRVRELNSAGTE